MKTRKQRRIVALLLVLGGPLAGWFLNADRGFLFGLVVSLLAIVWIAVEERKLL